MTENEVTPMKNGEEKEAEAVEKKMDEEIDLESAIIKQVEYYFGDINIPRDKFLQEQIKLDDGWVPFDILITFKRLAKLTTDTEVIAKALKNSKSGLLQVSEDNKKMRRNPEMPLPEMNEERRKELMSRTIYAKGFPKDAQVDDVLKFFKQFEEVENVIMRKYMEKQTKDRRFKGSVFATFVTKEQAEKFINTKDVKYGETALIVRWQEDYTKEKQEEYTSRKEKKEKKGKTENKDKEEKEEFKLPTGTLLHFCECEEKTTREDIKSALTPFGAEVAFVDFKSGDKEGWVRFTKQDQAKEVLEKLPQGKLKICETDVSFRLLEGEEEKLHLDKTIEEMAKRRRNQKNSKQHKSKNFKSNKRRRDHDGDGPPARKPKSS